MKKQFSDEQVDKLMRSIIGDSSPDDATINEIADSPTLWWSVQREIRVQKGARSPWPPALRRWLMVGVPALAAFALVSIFVFRPTGETTEQAGVQQNVTTITAEIPSSFVTEPAVPANKIIEPSATTAADTTTKHSQPKADVRTTSVQRKAHTTSPAQLVAKQTEIKSDFIALSYARSPESGQVIRVRVPSSMMVTLGLVASVEKPSNLVDAEVVVGDDGTTHAIRFIR